MFWSLDNIQKRVRLYAFTTIYADNEILYSYRFDYIHGTMSKLAERRAELISRAEFAAAAQAAQAAAATTAALQASSASLSSSWRVV